jgi:transcriptional regulator with XRE-family HTH domain
MTTSLEFGKRVEDIRKSKGVLNTDLANALGVTEQAVSSMQKGRNKSLPSKDQIEIIARVLKTSSDVLLGANEDILDRYTEEEQELLKLGESTQYIKLALAKMKHDMEAAKAASDKSEKIKAFYR